MGKDCERPYSNIGQVGSLFIDVGIGLLIVDCFLNGDSSCIGKLLKRFM